MSQTSNNIYLILAKTISIIFLPFYLPLFGMILLFWFSYMNMLPLSYRLMITLLVYLFTILFPTFLIRVYTHYNGWKLFHLGHREKRMVPYIISIVSYFMCYYILYVMHVPHFISSIVIAALVLQIIMAIINIWWKISTHCAAGGAVTGALCLYSYSFSFPLIWWLSLSIIISGMLGTARMLLRQHTLAQVVVGFLLGLIITPLALVFF